MYNRKKIVVEIILILIWMSIIFIFSSMPSEESNEKSKATIKETIEILNQTSVSKQNEEQLIEKLNKPLRKCMHATEYLILSILILNWLRNYEIKKWKAIVVSVITSFLYACTDEFHQLFVAGRTSQFTDVLIDTFGAILGVTMINVAIRIIGKIRQPKSTKKF